MSLGDKDDRLFSLGPFVPSDFKTCGHTAYSKNVYLVDGEKTIYKIQHPLMIKTLTRDFPGGPVVETPRFYCGGHGFNPWSGS